MYILFVVIIKSYRDNFILKYIKEMKNVFKSYDLFILKFNFYYEVSILFLKLKFMVLLNSFFCYVYGIF